MSAQIIQFPIARAATESVPEDLREASVLIAQFVALQAQMHNTNKQWKPLKRAHPDDTGPHDGMLRVAALDPDSYCEHLRALIAKDRAKLEKVLARRRAGRIKRNLTTPLDSYMRCVNLCKDDERNSAHAQMDGGTSPAINR